jgi:hypothetical protein
MNEEMKYFAEEFEEFLRKGHKLLNKMGQNMGQRRGVGQGYGNRGSQGYGNREDGGQLNLQGWRQAVPAINV